jgi:MoxR-like ATPase
LDAAIRGAVSEALRDAPQALDTAAVERIVRDVVDAGGILPPSTITVKVGERTVVEVSGIRHYLFETVLKALAAGEHLWLPGPAGSGKSTLARQALQALGYTDGAKERGIHMTGAVETVFQLIGYVSPNGDDRTLYTPLRLAVEFGGGFIFDDVDRSNPKALAAFNEGLANGYWTFPDRVIKQHADFICIATANTFGLGGGGDYVGAARMDKATLDRFTFIAVPYDETAESMIAGRENAKWTRHVQSVRKAVAALGLKHLVTPRATYRGVKLLAAGLDVADVESMTIFAGLDAETVQRIRGAL